MSLNDTIAAISTPIGAGGIGIIRVSGPEAIRVAAELIATDPAALEERQSHTTFYTKIVDPINGEPIDECLLTLMRGPRSYTREDIVEINLHSSTPTLRTVLDRVISLGARLAEPGEFTKRAFLSGRLDLTQAEAIGSLIRARSETAARAAARQAEGHLSQRIQACEEVILEVLARLEAAVDFSDEGIGPLPMVEAMRGAEKAVAELDDLIGLAERGRVYEHGLRTAILGRPNVGKSSLLNALAMEEKAIVSAQPGTTRDVIESTVLLGAIPLLLRDTAGWRRPRDELEAEGISRSHAVLNSAELILLVLDGSMGLTDEDDLLFESIESERQAVVVINKSDLPQRARMASLPQHIRTYPRVHLSALDRKGFTELESAVGMAVGLGSEPGENEMILADARQLEDLRGARSSVAEAIHAADSGFGEEVAAPLLTEAVSHLSLITGKNISEEILDRIFSRFCIGK